MDLTEMARDHKYVSITTFRRDGTPRPTPVWLADLGDGSVGFTTGLDSYKVKRIGHTPGVELRPCDVRGNVADDAPVATGIAGVVTGREHERVRDAVKAKYGLVFTLIVAWEQLKARFTRTARSGGECGVIVSPVD